MTRTERLEKELVASTRRHLAGQTLCFGRAAPEARSWIDLLQQRAYRRAERRVLVGRHR